MKNNRRNFLKVSGLAGLGLAGGGILNGFATESKSNLFANSQNGRPYIQRFNMSGYGAPKIETVRAGFIGLGSRGPGHVMNLTKCEGVEVVGLSDLLPENVVKVQKKIEGLGHKPTLYSGNQDEWKRLCDRKDVDLIYIATPWHLHVPMALYAMERGKHVAIEVPAAVSVAECWQLVETSERTKKHCMMLENCCYDFLNY